MAIGFVLISTAPAKEHEVYNELLKVKEIVRSIPGVIDTKTLTGIKF